MAVGGWMCAGCWSWVVGCGLWVVGCGLWAVGCGLWGVGCGLWAVGCDGVVWNGGVVNHWSYLWLCQAQPELISQYV